MRRVRILRAIGLALWSARAAKCVAMIKPCPDCGKDVSTDAQACPHCGKPVSRPVATTAKVVFGIIGGILLAIALMLLFGR